MSTERIDIEVREDGSRVVKATFEGVARSAEVTAASIELMQSALRSIQGTIKQPTASLQQMRSAMAALSSAAKSPGGLLDTNNINFATAALDRLRQATQAFAKDAPRNVSAAVGRVNMGITALSEQINKAKATQAAIAATQLGANKAAVGIPVNQPVQITGTNFQLIGQFKALSASVAAAQAAVAAANGTVNQFGVTAQKTGAQVNSLRTQFANMRPVAVQANNAIAAAFAAARGAGFGMGNAGAAAANAANQAASAIAHANRGTLSWTRSIYYLQHALHAVVGFLFLRELKEYIDTWIGIENSVRLSTSSVQEAAAVQDALFNAAQKARVPMEELVRLYRRLAQTQGNLGASQQDLIDLTEGVGMAIAVQGTSITSARGALLQLGQAMGMARVRAQEFNAINENAPRILQAVANNLKGANGSIDTLRQMMLKGSISGREFFEAFMKDLPRLREEFERVRPTIGQAFAVLDNAVGRYLFNADKGIGASTVFARSIINLAENIDTLGRALASVGIAAFAASLPFLIAKMVGTKAIIDATTGATVAAATGFRGLWAAISAHPIAAMVVAIGSAVSALYLFRDSIVLCKEEGITLGDVFRGTFQYIADLTRSFLDWFTGVWSNRTEVSVDPLLENIKKYNGAIEGLNFDYLKQDPMAGVPDYVKNRMDSWGTSTRQSTSDMKSIFEDFASFLTGKLDEFVRKWYTSGLVIEVLWRGMWANIKDLTVEFINDQVAELVGFVNFVIRARNILDSIKNPLAHVEIPELPPQLFMLTNENKGAAEKMGRELEEAFVKGMSFSFAAKLQEQIKSVSKSRQFWDAGGLWRPPDLTVKIPKTTQADGEVDKLQKKLDHLHATIDPVWGALHQIVQAEELLNKALAAGIPLWDTKDKIMEQVRKHYEDAAHPYEAHIRRLEAEINMEKQMGFARKGGLDALRAEEELKKKLGPNRELSQEQKDRIRDLYEERRLQQELGRAREQVYNSTIGAQRRYMVSQQALNFALKQGWIDLRTYHGEMAKLAVDAGQATWTQGFIAQLDILDKKMRNWAARSGQILADVTSGMVDAIANSTGQAIANWENFYDLLNSMARQVLSSLIAGFVKLGLQMLLNWALGKSLAAAGIAATVTMAAAAGKAWATPAALASLATYGTNAVAAEAALVGTTALANGLATGTMVSLETGGYTGNRGRKEMAGIVHGQEFVINADATRRHRTLLEALNRGLPTAGYANGGYVGQPVAYSPVTPSKSPAKNQMKVSVHNYSSKANVDVEQVGEDEIRIMVREETRRIVKREAADAAAAALNDPNTRLSRSVVKNNQTARRRG